MEQDRKHQAKGVNLCGTESGYFIFPIAVDNQEFAAPTGATRGQRHHRLPCFRRKTDPLSAGDANSGLERRDGDRAELGDLE